MSTSTKPKRRPAQRQGTSPAAQARAAAKRRAQQAQRRKRLWIVSVGAALLVFAVVIAVVSAGESGSAVRLADLEGSPEVNGDELGTPPADPTTDPAIGATAPVVSGAGFDGVPTTIGEPGSPQLLMFLASWCPACQEELPQVIDWIEAGGVPSEVEFTTVVTGLDPTRPNWPPDTWLEEEGYTGRVLVDDADGTAAGAYGLPATPYWVALDGSGEVAVRVSGLLDTPQLDSLVAAATGAG